MCVCVCYDHHLQLISCSAAAEISLRDPWWIRSFASCNLIVDVGGTPLVFFSLSDFPSSFYIIFFFFFLAAAFTPPGYYHTLHQPDFHIVFFFYFPLFCASTLFNSLCGFLLYSSDNRPIRYLPLTYT